MSECKIKFRRGSSTIDDITTTILIEVPREDKTPLGLLIDLKKIIDAVEAEAVIEVPGNQGVLIPYIRTLKRDIEWEGKGVKLKRRPPLTSSQLYRQYCAYNSEHRGGETNAGRIRHAYGKFVLQLNLTKTIHEKRIGT
ncbi:unnamed protein product [Haemonchus placei]|uniref:Ribosome maturation factor RimP n=1 Tax=Haemonchus placei TaxID=6290 RepID=A0A0N4X558_HAEPC|nr:unnamed protein product [Haemonchus placei]